MNYVVGCTGHRQISKDKETLQGAVVEKLKNILATHPEGVQVITGMALGFDQIVCNACLTLSIPYVAAVPCDDQDSRWNATQRACYKKLLASAASVKVISPGPYAAQKMAIRNRWIVSNSQEMIVYWDGAYSGGTGLTMKMINSKSIPYFNFFGK